MWPRVTKPSLEARVRGVRIKRKRKLGDWRNWKQKRPTVGKRGFDCVEVYSIGIVRVSLMVKIYRQDEMNDEKMKMEGMPEVEMNNWNWQ